MALFEQLIKIYEDSNGFFNSIDFFYGKKINRWINELDQNSGFDTQLSAVFVVVAMAMLIWFGQAGLWAWLSLFLCCLLTCASWRMMMCLHLNVEDQYSGAGSEQSPYFWIGSGLRPYFGLSPVLGQMNFAWIQFRSKKILVLFVLPKTRVMSWVGSGHNSVLQYSVKLNQGHRYSIITK